VTIATPGLSALRTAVIAFDPLGRSDPSWDALVATTAPRPDLSLAAHRQALLVWLNAWGCRIRYPRDGEPDRFNAGLARWWADWRTALPGPRTTLAGLSDRAVSRLADAYRELSATQVGSVARPRTLGPTAASKALYALRPHAVFPWDETIARQLHGARDPVAFGRHLLLGRDWAQRLLAEAATDERTLALRLGRPGRTLAKMLDDYCYVEITRNGRSAGGRAK
jgi:hypothetical protein